MQVTAKSNIKHDGQMFEKGQTLEVSEKQAADLLAAKVIEPVQGLKPTPAEPAVAEKSLGTDIDKNSEKAGIEAVANMDFNKSMTKEKLVGIARAKGLTVEKTATKDEVIEMLTENAQANPAPADENGEGATGGAVETDEDPTGAENNQTPAKVEESKETAKKEGLAPTSTGTQNSAPGTNPQFNETVKK